MEKILKITLCVFLFLGFFGCKESKLNIYNWEGHIDLDLVAKFEKEYKCKVTIDTFRTLDAFYNDMTTATRTKKYDVLVPRANIARKMYEEKMLRMIDHSKMPNLRNIAMSFIKRSPDATMRYSVPYMITLTGIAYNRNMIKDFKPSWTMFARDDLAGKIGMLDDMREVVGAALKVNSISYNATDDNQLRTAEVTLGKWKKNIKKIDSAKDIEADLKSGELYMIQDYNGNALNLVKGNNNIGFVIPEEGTAINIDTFVIPFEAENIDEAYKFINFFLDAEISKENMQFLSYYAPNLAAQRLLNDDFKKNPAINPSQDTILRSDYLIDLDDIGKYEELWRMMKR